MITIVVAEVEKNLSEVLDRVGCGRSSKLPGRDATRVRIPLENIIPATWTFP